MEKEPVYRRLQQPPNYIMATAIANKCDGDGRSIAIARRSVSARECPWPRGFAVSVGGLPQTEATSA